MLHHVTQQHGTNFRITICCGLTIGTLGSNGLSKHMTLHCQVPHMCRSLQSTHSCSSPLMGGALRCTHTACRDTASGLNTHCTPPRCRFLHGHCSLDDLESDMTTKNFPLTTYCFFLVSFLVCSCFLTAKEGGTSRPGLIRASSFTRSSKITRWYTPSPNSMWGRAYHLQTVSVSFITLVVSAARHSLKQLPVSYTCMHFLDNIQHRLSSASKPCHPSGGPKWSIYGIGLHTSLTSPSTSYLAVARFGEQYTPGSQKSWPYQCNDHTSHPTTRLSAKLRGTTGWKWSLLDFSFEEGCSARHICQIECDKMGQSTCENRSQTENPTSMCLKEWQIKCQIECQN